MNHGIRKVIWFVVCTVSVLAVAGTARGADPYRYPRPHIGSACAGGGAGEAPFHLAPISK